MIMLKNGNNFRTKSIAVAFTTLPFNGLGRSRSVRGSYGFRVTLSRSQEEQKGHSEMPLVFSAKVITVNGRINPSHTHLINPHGSSKTETVILGR